MGPARRHRERFAGSSPVDGVSQFIMANCLAGTLLHPGAAALAELIRAVSFMEELAFPPNPDVRMLTAFTADLAHGVDPLMILGAAVLAVAAGPCVSQPSDLTAPGAVLAAIDHLPGVFAVADLATALAAATLPRMCQQASPVPSHNFHIEATRQSVNRNRHTGSQRTRVCLDKLGRF